MAINFPSTPTLDQVYTFEDRTWRWNGEYWQSITATIGYAGSQGDTGYTGSEGDTGYTGSEGESSFTWGNIAPTNPAVGDRWYDTITSCLTVYVDDGDSQQWVEVAASGFLGQTGQIGYTGSQGDGGGPKISNVSIANSSYTILDDTAIALEGGYLVITGAGFASGCQVIVGSSTATSTTFVNSTTIRAQVGAADAGSKVVYVVNTDGGTAIRVNGLTYSATPTWVTGSTLPTGAADSSISIQLSATADSNVSYQLQTGSSLPAGLSLAANGLLTGTVTGIEEETTYSFTIEAIDTENQESPRTFSLTISVELFVEYLVIAGGAGGGGHNGGGGGAGGYRTSAGTSGGNASPESPIVIDTATNYTVTVGGGGAGGANANSTNGSNSIFYTITSLGGGFGSGGSSGNGGSGGSGGGSGPYGTANAVGTTGQGFAGGVVVGPVGGEGGGGGGAGQAGSNSPGSGNGGKGGDGLLTSIDNNWYAGGGGGSAYTATAGNGGKGGGGGGGTFSSGTAGTGGIGRNTGSSGQIDSNGTGGNAGINTGGGGGATNRASGSGGTGGSGIVILKYSAILTISNPGGGLTFTTSTAVAGFKITTFTAGTGSIQFN